MQALEKKINYLFKDKKLLRQALTHKSYGHEQVFAQTAQVSDNERLEFLGDAIVDCAVAEMLYKRFPEEPEGSLSKMRAKLVNDRTLSAVAAGLELNQFILLGKGESRSKGGEKTSILAGTLEALIAAIFLDGGVESAYRAVAQLFQAHLSALEQVAGDGVQAGAEFVDFYDSKSQLQELTHAQWKATPTYQFTTKGPDHARCYEIEVSVNGKILAAASGSSKKSAEQAAARQALVLMSQGGSTLDG